MTSLAFLSLSRVGHHRKVPHVPSNTERLQAFRRYQPVVFANTTFNGGGIAEGRESQGKAPRQTPCAVYTVSRDRPADGRHAGSEKVGSGYRVPPASTFPGTQPAIALPSRPHSPAAAGWVPSSSKDQR